jgi:hypothetical protein
MKECGPTVTVPQASSSYATTPGPPTNRLARKRGASASAVAALDRSAPEGASAQPAAAPATESAEAVLGLDRPAPPPAASRAARSVRLAAVMARNWPSLAKPGRSDAAGPSATRPHAAKHGKNHDASRSMTAFLELPAARSRLYWSSCVRMSHRGSRSLWLSRLYRSIYAPHEPSKQGESANILRKRGRDGTLQVILMPFHY